MIFLKIKGSQNTFWNTDFVLLTIIVLVYNNYHYGIMVYLWIAITIHCDLTNIFTVGTGRAPDWTRSLVSRGS